MIGETISHYRITDHLGRGGMGIVYRAEDTKLDRTVALKLLPPQALASEDDRARFYREARAAAALSHPNIAHVYEIDEAPVLGDGEVRSGSESTSGRADTRPFIAMEFIDGETLSDRIARSPLPLKDAISIATQIAEGLKAAHEKDIVHRDVKSGNVMLTKDVVVKILDFGLAKTSASTKLTQMGSTLGTAGYMSPEQAKGEEVDRRSDIWSLGVILYEMIAGQLPFRGDYEQAIVYGILNEDPESLTTLRAGVPRALDGIIAKLLAKDPSLRYQHVDELPADLKAIDLGSTQLTSRITTSTVVAQPESATLGRRRSTSTVFVAVGVAVGLLLGAVLMWLLTSRTETADALVRRYIAVDPLLVEGLENPASLGSAYISPDGSRIAFAADNKLWLRTLDNLRAVPIPGTDNAWRGFEWTPDGTALGFQAGGQYNLLRLDNSQVTAVGASRGWWEFLRDGSIAHLHSDHIYGPVSKGVTPAPLTTLIPGLQSAGFVQLPGDKGFIAVRQDSSGTEHLTYASLDQFRDLMALPNGSSARDLVLDVSGHLVYTLESDGKTEIWAVKIDMSGVEVSAGPVMVISNGEDPTIGAQGTLVYLQKSSSSGSVEMVFFDGDREAQVESVRGPAYDPEFSPDGQYLAFVQSNDIWILDRKLGGLFQLTFDGESPRRPFWAPDSKQIAFSDVSGSSGTRDIYVHSIERGAAPRAIVSGPAVEDWPSWSPDGRWILFSRLVEDVYEIWRVPADGSGSEEEVVAERFSAVGAYVSPDGEFVAYASNRAGQWDIFVANYPGGDRPRRLTFDGVGWLKWRGAHIYYSKEPDLEWIPVTTSPRLQPDDNATFVTSSVARGSFSEGPRYYYDIAANESEWVLMRNSGSKDPPRVIAVENWIETVDL